MKTADATTRLSESTCLHAIHSPENLKISEAPHSGDGRRNNIVTLPITAASHRPGIHQSGPPPQVEAGPDNASPIIFLSLTFDTPLPSPNNAITSKPESETLASSQPPPEPDLLCYSNPTEWSAHRKGYHMVICYMATLITAYCAGAYSPPTAIMQTEFHASRTAVLAGITAFCFGVALAAMVLAPLSEINGRYPIFVVSGLFFVIFQIACALATTLTGMLVCRFLVGVGGSVFSAVVGGVVTDIWDKHERNTPIAILSGSVLVGTGLGPMAASVMTYRSVGGGEKWRWVFWHQAIMGGVLMAMIAIRFKESRGSVVLSRKAKALNKWYEQREGAGYYGVWLHEAASAGEGSGRGGNETNETNETTGTEYQENVAATSTAQDVLKFGSKTTTTTARPVRLRWRVKSDEERESIAKIISVSVYRPFRLLFAEPVIFLFSLWVAFAWAVLYLTFASIPHVFETVYGWNTKSSGYIFAAMVIGAVLSTVIGVWQDSLLKHPQWKAEDWTSDDVASPCERGGAFAPNININSRGPKGGRAKFHAFLRRRFPVEVPESLLYSTCLTAVLLPMGLFLFGFTSCENIHWISPAIAVCLATMGIYAVYLGTFNYLADVYHVYASSALAAQSCCRNALGGVFSLVTLPLFEHLGNARAGGLLGAIATGLTFVPWVLVLFGGTIRARSSFAVSLERKD